MIIVHLKKNYRKTFPSEIQSSENNNKVIDI